MFKNKFFFLETAAIDVVRNKTLNQSNYQI